jgi:hypothetical protein
MRFFTIYRYYRSTGLDRGAAIRRAYRILVS